MKRIAALLLALLLFVLPALVACSKEEETSNMKIADLYDLVKKGEGFPEGGLTEADKRVLTEEASKEGYKLEFPADGSIKLNSENDGWYILYPNGDIYCETPDGLRFSMSHDQPWPTTGLAKDVPSDTNLKINYEIVADDQVFLTFENPSLADIRAYGQKLAAAGFVANEDSMDSEEIYLFDAVKGNLHVNLIWSTSYGTIASHLTITPED